MGLLETSLEVVKIAGKLANPELIQAATKANIEALELSQQNLGLQKQITELDNRIRELDDKLKLTGVVFRASKNTSVVFLEGDPTGFCSHCWDGAPVNTHPPHEQCEPLWAGLPTLQDDAA